LNLGPLENEAEVIINYKVLGAGKLQKTIASYLVQLTHSGVMKGKHHIKMAHEISSIITGALLLRRLELLQSLW
jgi:hypothetical protein